MTNCKPETIVLIKARARIEKEENWCKGSLTAIIGTETGYRKAYCSLGAIWGGDIELFGLEYDQAVFLLANSIPNTIPLAPGPYARAADRVWNYNDTPETTHDDVLKAFDRAIKLSQDEK